MGEDLLDIQELMTLLGYSDPRSVKKWCDKHQIPFIFLGLKKYVSKHKLTQYIDNQCVTFVVDEKATEKSSETENEKTIKTKSKYKAQNDLINKYLDKYESDTKTSRKK